MNTAEDIIAVFIRHFKISFPLKYYDKNNLMWFLINGEEVIFVHFTLFLFCLINRKKGLDKYSAIFILREDCFQFVSLEKTLTNKYVAIGN